MRDSCRRADTRLLATVHLYLHPSSVDTKYVGTMRVEFLNGWPAEAHDTRINSTVKPGGSPVNVSVTGQVTSRPGTYAVTIVLAATSTAVKKGQRDIRETVSVVVK